MVYADSNIWYTRGDAGPNNQMNRMVSDIFFQEAKIRLEQANKARVPGWRYLKEVLAWKVGSAGTLVKYPKLFYSPDCKEFEGCMTNAVYAGDEDNPKEDINTRMEEHACDDARYYVMGAVAPRRSFKKERSPYLLAGDLKRRVLSSNKVGAGRSFAVKTPEMPEFDTIINSDEEVATLE